MKRLTEDDYYSIDGNLKRQDVRIVREWLDKQPHLPKITDAKILSFLHSCYYKIEPTKSCVENYYTMKTHCPELFSGWDVSSKLIQRQIKLVLITTLPGRTRENYTVIVNKLLDGNAEEYDYVGQLRLGNMAMSDFLSRCAPSDGHVVVADCGDFTLAHMMKANLAVAQKHMRFVQEALPIRLKAIHMVNMSPVAEKMVNMMKPFIKKEMLDVLHFHRNSEGLLDYIDKDVLPEEYGGNAGSFKHLHETMKRNMMEARDYFLEEEKLMTDESKRVGRPKRTADIFGVEGTFKKLEID